MIIIHLYSYLYFNFFFKDKNDELLLNDDSKSIRRQVTINGGISVLKRYNSSDSVRYMLHNIDRTLNDTTLPFYDSNNNITLASSSIKKESSNCIDIEPYSIPISTTTVNTTTMATTMTTLPQQNNYNNHCWGVDDDNISPINYSSDESNSSSPVYIASEKIKDDDADETILDFSSTPSSPILMDKSKESYTKKKIIWAVPYFTALSTVAILAYFITSLIYNSTLTGNEYTSLYKLLFKFFYCIIIIGHAIQISPFNQMIGPAPEVTTKYY